ncbi:MAG: AhpC/TSA family protein [Flavobacteriaceae bacterium]|jgi:peroxiredoxin|nr:AhpC/TSA family protein [Flavobacteriaceae bacterium]
MKDIKQELDVVNANIQVQLPIEILEAFGQSIADLQTKEFGKTSKVGMLFSETVVLTENKIETTIKDLFGGKKGIISFVRGNWCPFCNVEIGHLLAYYKELHAKNVEVVVVSPMAIDTLKDWKEEMNMPFAIAQDKDLELAKALGIDFELQDFVQPYYEKLGIDIKQFNQTTDVELPVPAVYVVNEEGVITFAFIDCNYTNRLDLKEILTVL